MRVPSDECFLRERLQMVATQELKRFEAHDERKVERLVAAIQRDGMFFNPISAVRELIVIDGANRLEALRRLEARYVPCVIYDYSEIELLGNVHFLKDGSTTRLSEFAREVGERIEFPQRTPADVRAAAETGKLIPNGETLHRVPKSVIRLPISLAALKSDTPFDIAPYVERLILQGQIRFFQSSVYVCDEWHDGRA